MDSLISRQAAIDALERIFDRCEEIEAHLPDGDPDKEGYKMYPDYMTVWEYLKKLPSAQPESSFVTWLLDEIWDEDMWELNWQAFPEVLCRKLTKLGYIKEKDGEYERFDKASVQTELMMLPSAQPEQQWIPCSERLPEEWGDYLVTKKEIGWNCEEYQVNDIAYYDRDGFHKANTVLAWMTLPEPWKGEQDG